MCSLTSNIMFA